MTANIPLQHRRVEQAVAGTTTGRNLFVVVAPDTEAANRRITARDGAGEVVNGCDEHAIAVGAVAGISRGDAPVDIAAGLVGSHEDCFHNPGLPSADVKRVDRVWCRLGNQAFQRRKFHGSGGMGKVDIIETCIDARCED